MLHSFLLESGEKIMINIRLANIDDVKTLNGV